jgi:hypothetical protein
MSSVLKDMYTATSKNIALVIVDNRFNYLTVVAALISLYNVVRHKFDDVTWTLYVYTSSNEVKKYQNVFKTAVGKDKVVVEALDELDTIEVFHLEVYNDIMKSTRFWQKLKDRRHDKCITIQDDGVLMNGRNIMKFMDYDYVGAPWVDTSDNAYIKDHINPELVGNGGFSVRDVNKMIEVTEARVTEKKELFFNNINEIPEDVYFVKWLVDMGANVAPFDVGREFSIEQVLYQYSVGFHKFWMYHHPQTVQTLFDNFIHV